MKLLSSLTNSQSQTKSKPLNFQLPKSKHRGQKNLNLSSKLETIHQIRIENTRKKPESTPPTRTHQIAISETAEKIGDSRSEPFYLYEIGGNEIEEDAIEGRIEQRKNLGFSFSPPLPRLRHTTTTCSILLFS